MSFEFTRLFAREAIKIYRAPKRNLWAAWMLENYKLPPPETSSWGTNTRCRMVSPLQWCYPFAAHMRWGKAKTKINLINWLKTLCWKCTDSAVIWRMVLILKINYNDNALNSWQCFLFQIENSCENTNWIHGREGKSSILMLFTCKYFCLIKQLTSTVKSGISPTIPFKRKKGSLFFGS